MFPPEALSVLEQSLGRFPKVVDHVSISGVGFLVVALRFAEPATERLPVAAERGNRGELVRQVASMVAQCARLRATAGVEPPRSTGQTR